VSAHIAVVLYGSRGDVQPGLALALELQARGHRIDVAVPPNLAALSRSVGLRTVEIGLDTHAAWSSSDAEAARRSNPVARVRFALSTIRQGFTAFDDSLADAFVDPGAPLAIVDLIVAAPLCQDRCLALSERLGASLVVLRFAPMSENAVFGAIPGLTDRWLAYRRSPHLAGYELEREQISSSTRSPSCTGTATEAAGTSWHRRDPGL